MSKLKIINARLITPFRIIDNGCILIEDGKISHIGERDIKTEEYELIDAVGNYVSPGFIDIHTHGGGGHDFLDGTEEAFTGAAEKHAQYGTTSMVATLNACINEELKDVFKVFNKVKRQNEKGSRLLGLHLEGPYFALSQRGAQDSRYIRNPDPQEYEDILSWSEDIIRWSAAPELEGAMEFGRFLKSKDILVSVAHSDAVYEDIQEAYENGFTHMTHLYSGMSGVRRINAYRYAGVIESAYLIDDMTVEIIADGVHLPASLLKLIYKLKGPDRIALVTDSMRAAGMPEGESIDGSIKNGQRVIVEDGVAKLPDRTAFAGSVATADRLIRTMVNLADIPLVEAVRMMTYTPAVIMDINSFTGSLSAGKDADIIMFDDNINIKLTVINGRIVYMDRGGIDVNKLFDRC